jgi:cation/acetate symporter
LARSRWALKCGAPIPPRSPTFSRSVLLSIGVLITISGYEAALDVLVGEGILSRPTGLVVIGAVLALIVAPGGLQGLMWGAAACAGALLLALALPFAAQMMAAPSDPSAWTGASGGAAGWLDGFVVGAPLVLILASAIGIGALAPWAGVGAAAPDRTQALRAGASGFLLVALMAAGALADAAQFAGAGPTPSGIKAGVLALSAIAFASAGLFSATRAFAGAPAAGINAPRALASQRLARARGAALILVGLCGAVLRWRAVDPSFAVLGAVILSLAFVAPAFGLTFSARARGAHALTCFLVSLGAMTALVWPTGAAFAGSSWLVDALAAAALGFAAGWTASLFGRPRVTPPPNATRDPYFELPDRPVI